MSDRDTTDVPETLSECGRLSAKISIRPVDPPTRKRIDWRSILDAVAVSTIPEFIKGCPGLFRKRNVVNGNTGDNVELTNWRAS